MVGGLCFSISKKRWLFLHGFPYTVSIRYIRHPTEKVARASHSVFVAFISSRKDDQEDRVLLKEQLVFYYMQRALEVFNVTVYRTFLVDIEKKLRKTYSFLFAFLNSVLDCRPIQGLPHSKELLLGLLLWFGTFQLEVQQYSTASTALLKKPLFFVVKQWLKKTVCGRTGKGIRNLPRKL